MEDQQITGEGVKKSVKLSKRAIVAGPVKKRAPLVKSLSEQTSSKRRRQFQSFAPCKPVSILSPSTSASPVQFTTMKSTLKPGRGPGRNDLTSVEAKRTAKAMRAVRALQGLDTGELESDSELGLPSIHVAPPGRPLSEYPSPRPEFLSQSSDPAGQLIPFPKVTTSPFDPSASTHLSNIPFETRLLSLHPNLSFSVPNSLSMFQLDFFVRLLKAVENPSGSTVNPTLRRLMPVHSKPIVYAVKEAWEENRGREQVHVGEWERLSERFERGLRK